MRKGETMAEFIVPDNCSMGEAIWLSNPGDTIRVVSGHYGKIYYKGGKMIFPEDGSVTVGQACAVRGDNTLVHSNVNTKNIKAVYCYRKILPIKLRLKEGTSVYHPTGTEIKYIGDIIYKQSQGIKTAEDALPKSLVEIMVPSIEEIDFELLKTKIDRENMPLMPKQILEQEKLDRLIGQCTEYPYFGEIEYTALWALNHFLRQYSRMADIDFHGLTKSQFKDGVLWGYGRPDQEIEFNLGQHIEKYSNKTLSGDELNELTMSCLSSPDYTMHDYILYFLNHLNYSCATVGMVQLLETVMGQGKEKWTKLEEYRIGKKAKKYVAEVFMARNNIVHGSKLVIDDANPETRVRYGIEPMTEYAIYESKRPWYWYEEGVKPCMKYAESVGGAEACLPEG